MMMNPTHAPAPINGGAAARLSDRPGTSGQLPSDRPGTSGQLPAASASVVHPHLAALPRGAHDDARTGNGAGVGGGFSLEPRNLRVRNTASSAPNQNSVTLEWEPANLPPQKSETPVSYTIHVFMGQQQVEVRPCHKNAAAGGGGSICSFAFPRVQSLSGIQKTKIRVRLTLYAKCIRTTPNRHKKVDFFFLSPLDAYELRKQTTKCGCAS
ncbi:hypothetical protein T492DRAFT_457914 [Pavlovales sp. CCMP2436]|nr:hypothetical protein T492DRAFT_457914 [Pavlovales sp. CCMP2436]